VSNEDRREALLFLIGRGPEAEARRAVEDLNRRVPNFPGLPDLQRALARRETHERSLDELVKRLHLIQFDGVSGSFGTGDVRVPLRPQGREMSAPSAVAMFAAA
jgi:hypothetical protein